MLTSQKIPNSHKQEILKSSTNPFPRPSLSGKIVVLLEALGPVCPTEGDLASLQKQLSQNRSSGRKRTSGFGSCLVFLDSRFRGNDGFVLICFGLVCFVKVCFVKVCWRPFGKG